MSVKVQTEHVLDTLGMFCPIPIAYTKREMDQLDKGDILEVLADDPAALDDLTDWARRAGHEVVHWDRDGDEVHVFIRKLAT